jgi:O-antigen ligase
MIFVVPWENLFEKAALGTVGRVVGLVLAGVWVLSALGAGRIRQPRLAHGLMLGFVLWCVASILWSLAPETSRLQSQTYVQLVLLALIVWDLYDTPARLNTALQAYVLGCWVCTATLLEVFLSGDLQRRFTVGTFNENTLGFTLALALPMAWYLATTARHESVLGGRSALLLRVSNLAFIPAGVFGVALTVSRASMASALVAVGYMALSIGRVSRGARILLFGAAAAAAVYGVAFVPKTALDRLMNTGVEMSDGDWNGRLPIWNEALRMISERPFAGVGISAFHVGAVQTNAAPHNFVLSILAELGLIGFALFMGLLIASALSALRQPRGVASFWLAMLAVWLVNAAAHGHEDKKQTWLLFGLIAVSEGLRNSPARGGSTSRERAADSLEGGRVSPQRGKPSEAGV